MADIPATTPIVIPETVLPSKTFDLWAVPTLSFTWPDPLSPLISDVTFQRVRRLEGGVMEWAPDKIQMRVDNVWELAAQDEEIANALGVLLAAVTKIGMQKGIL